MNTHVAAALAIDVRSAGTGATVISVVGELDYYSGGQLRRPLFEATAAVRPLVVLDLASLEFIDSTGVGLFVAGLKRARAHRGCLALAAVPEPVREILALMGLTSVLTSFATVGDALIGLPSLIDADALNCVGLR